MPGAKRLKNNRLSGSFGLRARLLVALPLERAIAELPFEPTCKELPA
jgi:hypothetical protein